MTQDTVLDQLVYLTLGKTVRLLNQLIEALPSEPLLVGIQENVQLRGLQVSNDNLRVVILHVIVQPWQDRIVVLATSLFLVTSLPVPLLCLSLLNLEVAKIPERRLSGQQVEFTVVWPILVHGRGRNLVLSLLSNQLLVVLVSQEDLLRPLVPLLNKLLQHFAELASYDVVASNL